MFYLVRDVHKQIDLRSDSWWTNWNLNPVFRCCWVNSVLINPRYQKRIKRLFSAQTPETRPLLWSSWNWDEAGGCYHARGDHFLEPLGLGLVVQVDAAHQVVPCRSHDRKRFTLSLHPQHAGAQGAESCRASRGRSDIDNSQSSHTLMGPKRFDSMNSAVKIVEVTF